MGSYQWETRCEECKIAKGPIPHSLAYDVLPWAERIKVHFLSSDSNGAPAHWLVLVYGNDATLGVEQRRGTIHESQGGVHFEEKFSGLRIRYL